MPDLEQLRGLSDRVTPPPYDAITTAARRRDRRSVVRAAVVAMTAVGLVVVGMVAVRGLDSAEPEPVHPPITSPTPTPSDEPRPTEKNTPQSLGSMTPEEVVTAADAELEAVAVAPGDPDVRISTRG